MFSLIASVIIAANNPVSWCVMYSQLSPADQKLEILRVNTEGRKRMAEGGYTVNEKTAPCFDMYEKGGEDLANQYCTAKNLDEAAFLSNLYYVGVQSGACYDKAVKGE